MVAALKSRDSPFTARWRRTNAAPLKISPSTKILALLRTAADKNQVVVAASRSGHAMNITTTRDGKGIIAANPWASGSEKPEPMTESHFAREFAEVTFIVRP